MKITLPIAGCRLPVENNSSGPAAMSSHHGHVEVPGSCFRHSSFVIRHSPFRNRQSAGMALVISLILLSIITFMTVVFLVVSQRERGSVTVTTDATTARFAVDAALERAKAQLLATILATTNVQAYDLLVSTNYDIPIFPPPVNGQPASSYTNLLFDPRTMVYMFNPVTQTNENRFYLDLNRNGKFDANGILPVISPNPALPYYDTNGNLTATYSSNVLHAFVVGDPEYIGVLKYPDSPLSATNPFAERIAFIVLPAGKTLDMNYIHNQALTRNVSDLNDANDGYFRNEGVAPWEINLPAFFAALNTNQWNNYLTGIGVYQYNRPINNAPNGGFAFYDAYAMLRYRYANDYNTLRTATALWPNNPFANDNIDEYSDGPLFITTLDEGSPPDPVVNALWVGADSTNHFFTAQDLFDPNKTTINGATPNFITRLLNASTNVSSYDSYTYYRLLAQLGTDSTPESGKININYVNVDAAGNIVPSLATNFVQWQPVQFFTSAANLLLSSYFANVTNAGVIYPPNFGIGNIQIYPTNQYTPAVHRLLQLSANIYDATTNRMFVGTTNAYPSVFRPQFGKIGNAVYITNYVEVFDASFLALGTLRDIADTNSLNLIQPDDQVFGIPLVLGAKKGLPNFNEFAMKNVFQITRKILVRRATVGTSSRDYKYFVKYGLSVSNYMGVEAWNSYSNYYSRSVDIYVTNYTRMALTNDYGLNQTIVPNTKIVGATRSFPNPTFPLWPGYDGIGSASASFQTLLKTNLAIVRESIYRYGPPPSAPYLSTNMALDFETNLPNYFPQPQWNLAVTNRLLLMIVDHNTRRLLDYVQLSGLNSIRNLSAEIALNNNRPAGLPALWNTNPPANQTGYPNNMPEGIFNQIQVSKDNDSVGADWTSYDLTPHPTKDKEIVLFRAFFTPNHKSSYNGLTASNLNLEAQVPFTPTMRISQTLSWQANDPLVHYLAGDLGNIDPATPGQYESVKTTITAPPNIGLLNDRYQPWGGKPDQGPDADAFNMALKDSLMVTSDNWDFPTNKFPNVGWLGSVHRGTPWQTVYLKASPVEARKWQNWSGNPNVNNAVLTQPINDWRLFDLFTTAINENSTRGQLSVNQSGLAAWSAVLSGVVVLTNDVKGNLGWKVIQPAGASPEVAQIVQSINNTRANPAQFPQQTFAHAGDVLAAPQLTEQSPFLNMTNLQNRSAGGLSDKVIERIPQQIMSLLTLQQQPRFVIYSYGQTLRPAERSVVNSGPFFGLCTNYQVTAEMATRAVVRMEGTVTNAHLVLESFNLLPPD